MSPAPKVSIIMPVYNLGRYLDEAVDSALGQTFSDFEILIIDDGSTDPATVALLDTYQRPKTRVIRSEHLGVTSIRNRAIDLARGEYLTFFDCDDRMHPRLLERATACLDADPGLTFASCWVRLFEDVDWDWKPERCDLPMLLGDCSVATAALVRRQAVMDAGGFDPSMELGHEDWDLWLTLLARGGRGTIIPRSCSTTVVVRIPAARSPIAVAPTSSSSAIEYANMVRATERTCSSSPGTRRRAATTSSTSWTASNVSSPCSRPARSSNVPRSPSSGGRSRARPINSLAGQRRRSRSAMRYARSAMRSCGSAMNRRPVVRDCRRRWSRSAAPSAGQ